MIGLMEDTPDSAGIELVAQSVSIGHLRRLMDSGFGDLVKAVVDIERRIMTIGGQLHADEEVFLLETGSRQADLWGINLYPESYGQAEFVEFDSMINLRPTQGNRSRSVENVSTQHEIVEIVNQLVRDD